MGRVNLNKEIIEAIKERLEHGKKEYPEELDVNDGRDWVQESLEEALDLAVYITAKLLQIQKDKEDA
jgi:hypothetical protein